MGTAFLSSERKLGRGPVPLKGLAVTPAGPEPGESPEIFKNGPLHNELSGQRLPQEDDDQSGWIAVTSLQFGRRRFSGEPWERSLYQPVHNAVVVVSAELLSR
ncbi:MAG TPA: hypothetical protein VK442_03270 [Xanthobacteraceae bacterium]|nr:hypothetical protein [Xanthobacteraceae bacterium]